MRQRSQVKRVTMAHVARLAGVSTATVSFVVNNDPKAQTLTAATRERVQEAVQTLGYRPNHAARGLRTRRTQTLAFITDQIAATPFVNSTARGVMEHAWERGQLVTILATANDPDREAAAVDMVLSRQFDGVIYTVDYTRPVTVPASLAEVPTVLLNCYSDDGFTTVLPAEQTGARDATDLLIAAGHRRIAFINGLRSTYAAKKRRRGYEQALRRAGLGYDPSLVRSGTYQTDSGFAHARDLLAMDQPPTAILCASDRMAVGAYYAAYRAGLTIPDDVSVMGFDNALELVEYAAPPITTVHLPHYEMGVKATQLLLDEDGDRGGVHEVPCPPVSRSSVGPPRSGPRTTAVTDSDKEA